MVVYEDIPISFDRTFKILFSLCYHCVLKAVFHSMGLPDMAAETLLLETGQLKIAQRAGRDCLGISGRRYNTASRRLLGLPGRRGRKKDEMIDIGREKGSESRVCIRLQGVE